MTQMQDMIATARRRLELDMARTCTLSALSCLHLDMP